MAKVRFMGSHAENVSVGDKRIPVAPGDFIDMSDQDMANEDNAWLVESNMLVLEKDLTPSSKTLGGDK